MDEKDKKIPPIMKDVSSSVADVQTKLTTLKSAESQYLSAESAFKSGSTDFSTKNGGPSPYQKNYKNFANKMWNILFDKFGIDEINGLRADDVEMKQEHHIKPLEEIKKGNSQAIIDYELTDPGNLAPVSPETHSAINKNQIASDAVDSYKDIYNREYKKMKQAVFRRALVATFDFIWSTFIFGFLLTFLYGIIQNLLIEKKQPSKKYFIELAKSSAIVGLVLFVVSLPFSIVVTAMRLSTMNTNTINHWQLLFMALSFLGFALIDYIRNKIKFSNSIDAFKNTVNGMPTTLIFFVGMYLAEYTEKLVIAPFVICLGLKLLFDNVIKDRLNIYKNLECVNQSTQSN